MIEGEESNARTTLTRQRRDLFVISSLLLLAEIAEVNVEKLAFLGIELRIQNSQILWYGLWALWSYWFLRYYQVFRNLPNQPVFAAYTEILAWKLRTKAHEIATKETVSLITNNDAYRNATPADWTIHDQGWGKTSAWLEWQPGVKAENGISMVLPHRRIEFAGFRLHWMRCKAIVYLCLNRFEPTEYIFPFIFGLLPLFYGVYKHLFGV